MQFSGSGYYSPQFHKAVSILSYRIGYEEKTSTVGVLLLLLVADVVVHSVCPCQIESQGYFYSYAGRVQFSNLLVIEKRLPGSVRVSRQVTDGIAIIHSLRTGGWTELLMDFRRRAWVRSVAPNVESGLITTARAHLRRFERFELGGAEG